MRKPKKRTTLRDIAAQAGVSVASVSMALRSCGTISNARAESLRKLAESMGYRPNPLLASLAAKKFRTGKSVLGTPVAILNFPISAKGEDSQSLITDMYIGDLKKESYQRGYSASVFSYPFEGGIRQLERVLYHRMVQGIILHGSVDQSGVLDEFDWSHYAVVQCARFHISPQFHTARSNIFQSVKLAFEKILALGYRRIGLAIARHDIPLEDDQARHGAAVAVSTSSLPPSQRLPIFLGSINDREAFKEWVRATKPDAVLGFSLRFYWLLHEMGFSIPEEIGFASLHLPNKRTKDFSGLLQNNTAIARQSVVLLDQLVREQQRGIPDLAMHTLIPSTWVDGVTLRRQ